MASSPIDNPIDQPRRRQSVRWGHLALYLVLGVGAVLMLFPFAYMLSTSLKSLGEVFTTPVQWIPKKLLWDNYVTALREHPIGHYFRNSLFVAVSVTLLNLLTCSLAGYSFAKFRYPSRNLLFGTVLATMMIPLPNRPFTK